MWLRWCAFAMIVGLSLVVAGLGIAVNAQWGLVPCDACEGIDEGRLAVALSLLGVIFSSLSTAAVAGLMMRTARPRAGPRPAGKAPPANPAPLADRRP